MPERILVDKEASAQAQAWARRILRDEMIRRDLTFGKLAEMLDQAGVHENERNLRNKVARGEFSASFLLMCLKVMGCKSVSLDFNQE
jgi:hypothetical protein